MLTAAVEVELVAGMLPLAIGFAVVAILVTVMIVVATRSDDDEDSPLIRSKLVDERLGYSLPGGGSRSARGAGAAEPAGPAVVDGVSTRAMRPCPCRRTP